MVNNVNDNFTKNARFIFTSFAQFVSSVDSSMSLVLYDCPTIFTIWEWCNNLSSIAFVMIGSKNISDHFDNALFVVIIVDIFSYLNDINWKNIFAAFWSRLRYPISSMIKTRYLAYCFSLASNLFSDSAKLVLLVF